MKKYIHTNLYIHLSTLTGEKPYMCCHCGKTFEPTQCLVVHMMNHIGEKQPLRLVPRVICECLYGRLTHKCLVFLQSGANNIISGSTCQHTQGKNHISAVIVTRPLCKINECQLGRNHIKALTKTRLSLSSVDLKYI